MHCYDCTLLDETGEAVGVCHNCGAAVCIDHAHVASVPVHHLVGTGVATSRRPGRLITCRTCHAAASGQEPEARRVAAPAPTPR